jgi:hypothetical protein
MLSSTERRQRGHRERTQRVADQQGRNFARGEDETVLPS